MQQVKLRELNMKSRSEALSFLKKLWDGEGADCPICGHELETLHKKTKKGNCDWQCKSCDKTFKTIQLLDEINQQMPN